MRRKNSLLDDKNRHILSLLQKRARISNAELADSVGLSASACLQRVNRLEESGVIREYCAELDIRHLGPSIRVVAEISLRDHAKTDFDCFEKAIADIPEITDCFKVSGAIDYIAHFLCSDTHDYMHLSDSLLESDLGIARVSSHVVLTNVKEHAGIPLDKIYPTADSLMDDEMDEQ